MPDQPGADQDGRPLPDEGAGHAAGGLTAQPENEGNGGETTDAIDDEDPAEAEEILQALEHAFDDRGPERGEADDDGDTERGRVVDLEPGDPVSPPDQRHGGHEQPDEEGGAQSGADGPGEEAVLLVGDGGRGLLGKDDL